MIIKDIISLFNEFAPPQLQESYDNSGIQVGSLDSKVTSILLTIDITEEVIEEAINLKANLIISHHPLIFNGIKKITNSNMVERCITKAIKNDITLFSVHTNLDAVSNGVNYKICQKLGLINCRILANLKHNGIKKLVTYVPEDYVDKVRIAIMEAGAGSIGNYDFCSFNTSGIGTFRGNASSNPFAGKKNTIHSEPEVKIETIVPENLISAVIGALIATHPYEEVAYDVFPLENSNPNWGMGMVGEFKKAMPELDFLKLLKKTFGTKSIKHTMFLEKKIKKVAVCGGSGSFLISNSIRENVDAFVTGDIKYHQFFEAENKIILADIGHFESEQFTIEIFYEQLMKKFSNFAIHFSKVNTNPINYY